MGTASPMVSGLVDEGDFAYDLRVFPPPAWLGL